MLIDRWLKNYRSWRNRRWVVNVAGNAIKEVERERRTKPYVRRYPEIPQEAAPWPNQGIRLDDPCILLRWGSSEEAVNLQLVAWGMRKNLVTEGSAWSDIRASLMGLKGRLVLNYFSEFEDPHNERGLASCALIDLPTDSPDHYPRIRDLLIGQLGEPLIKDEIPKGWPNFPRTRWDFEYSRLELAVTTDRGDNPILLFRQRRKGLPKLEEASAKHGAQYF